MIYVLDASAIIAVARHEPGGAVVESLLKDDSVPFFMHAANLCEVYYDLYRTGGAAVAREALATLSTAGVVRVESMSASFCERAATLKAVHRRISLADCFALTLAQRLDATLLTADHHEFDSIAAAGIAPIRFIR